MPLSGKRYRKEVKAAGRLAVGPEKQIVKGEKRASKVQQRRIRDWFPQYQEEIQKAANRTTSAYSQADQRMENASSVAADYANRLRQELASEAQADAQNRGVTYDPSGSETNVAAQLARINSTDTLRGVTSAQGAAQNAYFQDKSRIAGREKIEQLLTEQARRRAANMDLKDLARRQGDAQLAERGRLRDSERDYYLGLLAARGEKKAQAFTEQNARADRRFSRNESAKDRANTRWTDTHGTPSSGSGGGKDKADLGGEGVRSAMAEVRREKGLKSNRDVMDFLISQGYSKKVAQQAINRFHNKANKPKNVIGGAAGGVGGAAGGFFGGKGKGKK
jgi:hypothetical protein